MSPQSVQHAQIRTAAVAALALAWTGAAAVAAPPASAAPSAIGGLDPGVSSHAIAVNEAGDIAGSTLTSGQWRGFLAPAAGGLHEITPDGGNHGLEPPYEGDTSVSGLSESGMVVGTYQAGDDEDPRSLPFAWTAATGMRIIQVSRLGRVVDVNAHDQVLVEGRDVDVPWVSAHLWTPNGQLVTITDSSLAGQNINALSITPAAINDGGSVVGTISYDDFSTGERTYVQEGFVWSAAGGLRRLTAPSGWFEPADISDSGVVVGTLHGGGSSEAALWHPMDGWRSLGFLPGGSSSSAHRVTDSGLVLGQSNTSDQGDRAFVWTQGAGMADVGSLGGGTSRARDLSDEGTVVGSSLNADGHTRAFAWRSTTGIVDLGSLDGSSNTYASAADINESGLAVGDSSGGAFGRATRWDTTDIDATPDVPGTARHVTAAAGDGSAQVAWSRPVDNGGLEITRYTVTAWAGGTPITSTSTDPAPPYGSNRVTIAGLDNDVSYSFTVTARNALGDGPASDASAAVVPRAGAAAPRVVTAPASPDGGYASSGGASNEQPVAATVVVPAGTDGGAIIIAHGTVDQSAPQGFSFLSHQVNITAPNASAETPLQLTFELHSSAAGGATAESIQIFRTGPGGPTTVVPDCADPSTGAADPDPCVHARTGGEVIQLVVLTSAASAWNLGVAAADPEPYPFTGFFPPVDNVPTVNVTKAGAAVPVKFSLGGDRGLGVLAEGSPTSSRHPCGSTAAEDRLETTAEGPAGQLRYDAATERYEYVWKTSKAFAGQCRTFELALDDGSVYQAEFRFR